MAILPWKDSDLPQLPEEVLELMREANRTNDQLDAAHIALAGREDQLREKMARISSLESLVQEYRDRDNYNVAAMYEGPYCACSFCRAADELLKESK